jgi:hypothetical protein
MSHDPACRELADYFLGASSERPPLSYGRAVQIMIQSSAGGLSKDGAPSIYIDEKRRCFVYRENVIEAIQIAATFAWDNVVMPGTSLHKNYELLRALSLGKAAPQEQLEAAVLIRGLLGTNHE